MLVMSDCKQVKWVNMTVMLVNMLVMLVNKLVR